MAEQWISLQKEGIHNKDDMKIRASDKSIFTQASQFYRETLVITRYRELLSLLPERTKPRSDKPAHETADNCRITSDGPRSPVVSRRRPAARMHVSAAAAGPLSLLLTELPARRWPLSIVAVKAARRAARQASRRDRAEGRAARRGLRRLDNGVPPLPALAAHRAAAAVQGVWKLPRPLSRHLGSLH